MAALAAGDAILALIARDVSWNAPERVLYGWIIGFAAVGFGGFVLALGGWLYREVALGPLVAGSAAALVWWSRRGRGAWLARGLATECRRLFAAEPVLSAFVLCAVCLSMLGAIVWSVAPEIRTDALVYQLAVPQTYVDHHGLVNLPGNFRSYWVGLANLPSTLGLLLTGQPLPQLFVVFQGVLLAWQGLVLFGRLGGARAGLLAAGFIATTPYLLRLESTSMTDVPAAVLTFGALSAATRWGSDGLGRGSATVEWSSRALSGGELVLSIDGETEIPLAAGRSGTYRLRQLKPGFDYAVRLYATDENGRVLAAEAPVRVWTD